MGLDLLDGYTPERLCELLPAALGSASLPRKPSVVELMTHPGELDAAGAPFSRLEARVREVQALTHDSLRRWLKEQDITIVSFGGLS